MAGEFEAATGALVFLAFWSAFPRWADLGAIFGLGGNIVTSPATLTVSAGAPVGTVVGTIAVVGGTGTYTFTLTADALGYFTIVGNQLQVNSASMSPGVDNITIQATGTGGDVLFLNTTVSITPSGYVPTYYLYGF